MAEKVSEMEVEELILRCLRDFYPIKADMDVVLSTVQRNGYGYSIGQISEHIRSLRDQGWIDESVLKGPQGKTEMVRLKITPPGIEHLRSVEMRGVRDLSVALAQVKNQLELSYDQIRADVERIGRDLERNKRDLAVVKMLIDMYVEKAETERVREEQLILRVLSGDEKFIYYTILHAGGEMLQKELVIRTKLSNAKASRTIDRLEGRGILTKERHGATNRLRITVNPPEA